MSDSGHSYPTVRRLLGRRVVWHVIPGAAIQRPTDGRHGLFDYDAYRERKGIERLLNRALDVSRTS